MSGLGEGAARVRESWKREMPRVGSRSTGSLARAPLASAPEGIVLECGPSLVVFKAFSAIFPPL